MSDLQQKPSNGTGGYRRASRKGAPRRYQCPYPDCDKIYSRQEHLQRHQLNHSPKEIFACDVENCGQRFVRADLLARHRKRHSGSYAPRNRVQSFADPQTTSLVHGSNSAFAGPAQVKSSSGPGSGRRDTPDSVSISQDDSTPKPEIAGTARVSEPFNARLPPFSHQLPHDHHDAASLLTPESTTGQATGLPSLPSLPSLPQVVHGQTGLPQISSVWNTATSVPDLTVCDPLRLPKGNVYYPPHPKPEHSQHIQQHQNQQQHQQPHPQHYQPRGNEPAFQHSDILSINNLQFPDAARDYFAVWLFDNEANYGEFNVSQLPFVDGGLESPFNNNIHYDYESLTSRSHMDMVPLCPAKNDDAMTETRRQELLAELRLIRTRRPQTSSSDQICEPSLELMNDCLYEYWENISPRLPIIHQPTFSCNTCQPLLLMAMVALGGASLQSRHGNTSGPVGNLAQLSTFADAVITSARWEILTAEDASPPVALWVAQALLVLEFYEKMYSSRRLHERAHIYHSATLTLLRRGSPLIGRSGSDTPPDDIPPSTSVEQHAPHPELHQQTYQQCRQSDSTILQPAQLQAQSQSPMPPQTQPNGELHAWWTRWAATEAMHRVVFAAFCFDITHAAMFGHAADMAPHEIRLPLPCDDNLWTASRPDDVRKLDANLRMYGVKPIFFLDGLKRALHGEEVKTHSFGRMIIMSGLLSVGWHLSHRETHVRWVEPSSERQEKWHKILLKAFENWKASFDQAQGSLEASSSLSGEPAAVSIVSGVLNPRGVSNGPIQSAAVLFHLAHISLYVDIVDCQVYAGAKRLLGRKVTSRDYANVMTRMRSWATQPSTRRAILHAFQLLRHVLVDTRKRGAKRHRLPGSSQIDLPPIENQTYSCRTESDPHRPWIMYYAVLSIWSFAYALTTAESRLPLAHPENYRPLYLQQWHPQQYPQAFCTETTGYPSHLHNKSQIQTSPPLPRLHAAQLYQSAADNLAHQNLHHRQPDLVAGSSVNIHQRVTAYLSRVADLPELKDSVVSTLPDGLPDLLEYLHSLFTEARSELLQEARARLAMCRDILLSSSDQ